ncbi:hypothetical protein [Paenibacillus sp. OV219]|uniref:hypothetical protein n=1 Tax=Paenibacillus sp. OV219 TaxID=1884377 RepID=UPI0008C2B580|nr:hypothetical protein [Paenibacillus sp. OV219]SEN81910.1 hypothetical protein SAMN05518847_104218 [Paenibacillus sp. OV219]
MSIMNPNKVSAHLQNCRITRIECFRFDHEFRGKLLHREETDICGLIAISTNVGVVGFKEFRISTKSLTGDLTMWATLFQRIKGLTLIESIGYPQLKQEVWGHVRVELIESALMDIVGKMDMGLNNRELPGDWDRAYLFNHAQEYVSF